VRHPSTTGIRQTGGKPRWRSDPRIAALLLPPDASVDGHPMTVSTPPPRTTSAIPEEAVPVTSAPQWANDTSPVAARLHNRIRQQARAVRNPHQCGSRRSPICATSGFRSGRSARATPTPLQTTAPPMALQKRRLTASAPPAVCRVRLPLRNWLRSRPSLARARFPGCPRGQSDPARYVLLSCVGERKPGLCNLARAAGCDWCGSVDDRR
jgi:hypothetical protein